MAVLTHKMRIKFDYNLFTYNKITPQVIADEVDLVGFSAQLLETIIDNSGKLREENLESDYEIDENGTKGSTKIKSVTLIIQGMTCQSCKNTIERHL